jgi:hypothetical protein
MSLENRSAKIYVKTKFYSDFLIVNNWIFLIF